MTPQSTINIMTYVLEDNEVILSMIQHAFKREGIEAYRLYNNDRDFLESLNEDVHIAVIDYYLNGDKTGLDVLKILMEKNPQCYVIVMSSQSSKEVVVDFMNAGAWRYVDKTGEFVTRATSYVKQAVDKVQQNLAFYNSLITKMKRHGIAAGTENVEG